MKNLISYKKSGLNALRKAFSLIAVLCTFLQGAKSQDLEVHDWWGTLVPSNYSGSNVSRVVQVDDCGMIYRVYVVSDKLELRKFVIRYKEGKKNIAALNYSLMPTSSIEFTNNFVDDEGQKSCQIILLDGKSINGQVIEDSNGKTLYVSYFYLNFNTSPATVTVDEPESTSTIKITSSTNKTVDVGATVSFTSLFCPANDSKDEPTYSWKLGKIVTKEEKNDTLWIEPSTTNTGKDYDHTVVYDKGLTNLIKCEATYTDKTDTKKTISSNVIVLDMNEPTFDVEIIGEGVRNVNSIEKEVPSWRDVVIKLVNLPSQNVSNAKIYFVGISKGKDAVKSTKKELEGATLNDDQISWNFYADTSGWMRVTVDVEVIAADGTSKVETLEKIFLFRLVYSPDKEDAVQELFFDDFGYFVGDTYHYVEYKDGEVKNEDATLEVATELKDRNLKWMNDPNDFVKEHDYALTDTRRGDLPKNTNGEPDRNDINCWSKPEKDRPFQCWCENGYRIEDGYYAIVPDPAMAEGGLKTQGEADYWKGTDHTGSSDGSKRGAMLMVNCSDNSKDVIIYERDFEITGECSNVMVLFSAFVSNAQALSSSGTPVNIRMDIYEKEGTEVLTSIESGDVISRSYGPNSWSNLTALFPLKNNEGNDKSKFYTLKITNNSGGGSGNDILLDDISLKVCFPEIEVEANVESNEILNKNEIVICGKSRDLKLSAFNRAGIENYIPTPSYLFQYFENEKWISLKHKDTGDTISDRSTMDITLDNNSFNGHTRFRVIVGNSEATIKKVLGEDVDPDCQYTYAISDTFHVKFNPVGSNLDLFGCIGETITVDADANGRPTVEWIDMAGNKLVVNDSIKSINGDKLEFIIPESILNSSDKSDTLYMLATTEGNLCVDTQFVSITKYDDLDFNIVNDVYFCEFDSSIKAVDVYPTSGINYEWTLKGSDLPVQTGSEFKVLKSNPEIFDNTVSVTGTATGYCPITKTADFSIYRRYSLDLTVDVNGTGEKVANICLPTDGSNKAHVDLDVKKVYAEGSNPSYADEKVTTYSWYRITGEKDSLLIHTGTETSYVDYLTDNNVYKYAVTAVDKVCYKNDVVASSDNTTINARKPLVVKLTEDKTELCKNEDVTLTVKISNALKPDTITSFFFENDGALTSLVGFPDADTTNSYNYTPENNTKEKATKNIKVEVADMICSPSKPVSDQVSFDVFVPLKVSLISDADGGVQKCIRNDIGDDSINVTLKVEEGNPRSIEWFDGLYPGLVYTRKVTINPGVNKISVKAYDDVCRTTSAAGFVEGADTSISITGQEPISIKITADKKAICNGEPVELTMNVTNSLTANPVVKWYELYDNKEELKYTDSENSVTVVKSHTPTNPTDFVVKKTMAVKTSDDICSAGKDVVDTVSYNIYIPIELSLTHDAVVNGSVLQKCITKANIDNVINLEVKVKKGNPSKLTWSDNKYNDDLVFKREFVVSPGSNPISVVGSDGVCSASSNDNDALTFTAASPISLTLSPQNPDVCEGSGVKFDLEVINTLNKERVEVRWYDVDDESDMLFATQGAQVTQSYVGANPTTSKLGKTMVVMTDDEICSPGTPVRTTADYTVYKPVKFTLTSDASEFGNSNTKCLGQTSSGSQTGATVYVNLIQGNPVKFVWSDDVVWEWSWTHINNNITSRNYELQRGTNTLSVVAYDNVCNKAGDSQYTGENGNISIEARTPIQVSLDLASGRDVMCKGEEISLIATVHNDMPGERTKLEWSENHGVADGLVDNGSYTTDVFTPNDGYLVYTVQASENTSSPICPSQSASKLVDVRVNTTLKLYTSDDAICQDTSGKDSVKLVKLTARVLTGQPLGIIWSTGDTTNIDTAGYSYLKIAPMEDIVYSAYGYDLVCAKTTPAYTDTIDVDHRVYVTLSAEDYKVQMGEEVELRTEYSIPAEGMRHYEMTMPRKDELDCTYDSELNWQLDEPGAYKFRVKLENGNCGVSKSNVISVDVADYVVVPNVITPYNGNPKNDRFMEGYDVMIFNRYQETVYEGKDGWDATYRGELASPGTYFYVLTKKDGRVLKGTVEVYRK